MAQMVRNGDTILEKGELPSQALTRIRDLIVNGSTEEALRIIQDSLETFFSNLIDTQKDDVQLAGQVLRLLKDRVPEQYSNMLMLSLQSTSLPIRKFAIEQVYNLIKENPGKVQPENHVEGYTTIIGLLSDKDPSVFNKAILILSELDVEKYSEVLKGLKVPLKGDKTSRCNAFDVIVNISTKSEAFLLKCASDGFIDSIVDELIQSNDILYQLSLLELLTRLVVTPHCFAYFTEREIFESIADTIPSFGDHPMSGLLLPGYLKFFGAIAHLHPSGAFRYYPAVVECLLDSVQSGEPSLLPVALDTLGYVGTSVEGKLCLAEIGAKFQSAVSKVSEYIRIAPSDIKIRALNCMQGLVSVEQDQSASRPGPVDLRVTLMTREWFRSINPHGNAMEVLYETCKNPFPDIRLAAFGLLDAVIQHQWGNEMVATTPGFVEFLLDRSVEHTKETKEAKYGIVKRLSRSHVFDPTVTVKMTTYLEQGAFYTEMGLEVAMEEDN